jgi:thioesterase domain-containing protein
MDDAYTFIYVPGAGGGGEHDIALFASGLDHQIRFETLRYPGWQRYVEENFSINDLVSELAAEVIRKVPTGPIRILGLSIGGHFGYAVGLLLEQMGREVSLFCAIDSFMVASSEPRAGWQARAIADAFDLLKKGRFGDFARLLRSKGWRMVLRLAGGRLAGQLRRFSTNGQLPAMFAGDAVAEEELSMRLLLREATSWITRLDHDPNELAAPAMLLRTQASSCYDEAWRGRCPRMIIREVPGKHLTLFESENIGSLRRAFEEAAGQLETFPQTETP